MNEYYIPSSAAESEYTEKKSRFIGHLQPVESEAEARSFIDEIKHRYHDARHNCWCYIIRDGGITRYSDDGEPQGTAGQPMLAVFEKAGLTNLVFVSTRYFGGVLLGTGGLVRAYSKSAKDTLDNAGISVVTHWKRILVDCSYNLFERLRNEAVRFGVVIENVEYGTDIVLTFLVKIEDLDNFKDLIRDFSAGKSEMLEDGDVFTPVRLEKAGYRD